MENQQLTDADLDRVAGMTPEQLGEWAVSYVLPNDSARAACIATRVAAIVRAERACAVRAQTQAHMVALAGVIAFENVECAD